MYFYVTITYDIFRYTDACGGKWALVKFVSKARISSTHGSYVILLPLNADIEDNVIKPMNKQTKTQTKKQIYSLIQYRH